MRAIVVSCVIAGIVAAAWFAQDAREGGAPPTLHPPIEGVAIPSAVAASELRDDMHLGTFPLARFLPAVVDGDTIRVEGLRESLRLIGLDAEETFKDPGKRRLAEKNWNEYVLTETAGFPADRPPKYATFMGEAAREGVRALLQGVTEVRLEFDEPQRKVDTFGRHLVLVLFQRDGAWTNLNVEIVRQGYSPYFVKYGRSRRFHAGFEAAQREAQAHERGIWREPATVRHYPDYPVRLTWWKARADLIDAAEALRAARDDVFILGRDDDWERLKKQAGRRVTVFGSPDSPIVKERLVLLPLAHRRGIAFMIVGSQDEIGRLEPGREAGNLLFVTGVVDLYRGEPQFRAGTTSWTGTAPPLPESRAPPR